MNRIASRITLGVALGLLSLVPATASAQTTFTACRVPDVGAIYMIGVSGAPTDCLDASHVEFSWTEGGAPGANSITSAMIVDGTIAAADIDAAEVQARVSASCSTGTAVRVIAVGGGVTCQPTSGNVAGTQETGFGNSASISGTSGTELLTVAVPGSTSGIVTVTAHAYVEKDATTTGRYRFELRLGDCAGGLIGVGWWRPLTAASGFEAQTISVTGTATGVGSATTIAFCGSKFDAIAPTATAYLRGMVAHW